MFIEILDCSGASGFAGDGKCVEGFGDRVGSRKSDGDGFIFSCCDKLIDNAEECLNWEPGG